MLIPNLLATLHYFRYRHAWKIIALAIIYTLIIIGCCIFGVTYIIDAWLEGSWFSFIGRWLGTGLGTMLGYFLAPVLFPLISVLFLEKIVAQVEQNYYKLPPTEETPFMRSMAATVKFTLVTLSLNLLILPLILFPIAWIPLYYMMNSYLYAREYFELVALRNHSITTTRQYRRRFFMQLMPAGLVIMLMFTIPLLNLLAPVIAAVFITHTYRSLIYPTHDTIPTTPHT